MNLPRLIFTTYLLYILTQLSIWTRSPYRILGVPITATDDDIKAAYVKIIRTAHPDKGGDAKEFIKATEARDLLLDHDKREHYDFYGPSHGILDDAIAIQSIVMFTLIDAVYHGTSLWRYIYLALWCAFAWMTFDQKVHGINYTAALNINVFEQFEIMQLVVFIVYIVSTSN
jgi:hypothetical protein